MTEASESPKGERGQVYFSSCPLDFSLQEKKHELDFDHLYQQKILRGGKVVFETVLKKEKMALTK
ncbi:MAG: hypothetical protein KAR32_11775 [Candidatus Omnitrophica bacterium]|nr:hypothetical protein [Candidatus Omnitrophota bacterium]